MHGETRGAEVNRLAPATELAAALRGPVTRPGALLRPAAEFRAGAVRVDRRSVLAEVLVRGAQVVEPARLTANLIDMDLQALAFVADKRDKLRLSRRMITHNENLIFLALGRKRLELANQDLVYSIGLIDYFGDDMVVRLLNWIHGILRPGGKVILGNFHPNNPTKALMDYVLEWKLIHRGEEDMDRLYRSSLFGRPSTAIRWEEQRINLFAGCVKE